MTWSLYEVLSLGPGSAASSPVAVAPAAGSKIKQSPEAKRSGGVLQGEMIVLEGAGALPWMERLVAAGRIAGTKGLHGPFRPPW